MLYGFLIKMNNSWFQSIIKPDLKGILGKGNIGKKNTGMGLTPCVTWQLSEVPHYRCLVLAISPPIPFLRLFQVTFPNTTLPFPAL